MGTPRYGHPASCRIARPSPGSDAAGPFLWIHGSPVEVWALGEDRFAVSALEQEEIVTGLEEAQQAADASAERLG